ncbi:LysR family transcriptional regulator [Alphaproteobacteria bacterium KMM 3653]|uniref:LysR family transcriptional regulator n=1 Tax=Harenicola maris TaxID=2841044 RepID=A0AAP2CTF0_9RHOB|nr:LysR family transcriptional regulator [Harenicola maris]
MDTRHIHYLRRIAEYGTISGAARSLNMTQSALTKILSRCEDLLGLKLFERTPKGVELSALGEFCLSRMERIESDMTDLSAELRAHKKGISGTIKLGVGQAWLWDVVPEVIVRIAKEEPNIQVKIHTGPRKELFSKLRRGQIDIMLGRVTSDLPTDFVGEVLTEVKIFLAFRKDHPLLKSSEPITYNAVKQYGWVLPPTDVPTTQEAFDDVGLEQPVPAVETVSNGVVQSVIRRTDYVTIVPAIAGSKQWEGIHRLQVDWLNWSRTAGMISVKNRRDPACKDRFVNILKSTLPGPPD